MLNKKKRTPGPESTRWLEQGAEATVMNSAANRKNAMESASVCSHPNDGIRYRFTKRRKVSYKKIFCYFELS